MDDDIKNERPPHDEPGPERREGSGPDGKDRRVNTINLVEDAAAVAAQAVAKIHRRRLVFQSFLAALIASTLITIPVVLITQDSNSEASLERARFNCAEWSDGAGVLKDLVKSIAKRRQDERKLAEKYPEIVREYNRIFGAKLVATFFKDQGGLDARQNIYLHTRLIPRIELLAGNNCDQILTKDGVDPTQTIPRVNTPTITVPQKSDPRTPTTPGSP